MVSKAVLGTQLKDGNLKLFFLNNESDKLHSLLMGCITSLPSLKENVNIYSKSLG